MAVKKNELYSSLWASCDKLRGGMDASQYKDYILTLLFVKYVTDRFKGERYADISVPDGGSFDDIVKLKGDKNIGEGIDKVIAKLAEANELQGVIDNAHFNDDKKLGNGQEMVDKLTGLVSIFQRPELDFKNNRADDDDIIGDAYEYLMRNFATESGRCVSALFRSLHLSFQDRTGTEQGLEDPGGRGDSAIHPPGTPPDVAPAAALGGLRRRECGAAPSAGIISER